MSITSLTCHIVRAFPFPCAAISLQNRPSCRYPSPLKSEHDTGVRLGQHSQLHLISTSSWHPCGRTSTPFPTKPALFLPLSTSTRCSWCSQTWADPPSAPGCHLLSLPSCFAFISPLMFATHQPEPDHRDIPSTWPRQGAGISSGLVS